MHSRPADLEWFAQFKKSPSCARFRERPIAYFSAEYGIASNLPLYAGGLGILAGDLLKEAADMRVPMVGVGMYYLYGYSCLHGTTQKSHKNQCLATPPETAGLTRVCDTAGKPIVVSVPLDSRTVSVGAWIKKIKGVPLYLLDTDISENNAADRKISHILYVNDKETRFKQEMVLGIGGMRLLERMGIHPFVYHLNEGHSSLLVLELIAHEMKERKLDFRAAFQFARRRIVFTNHTLVPAGQETYGNDMVSALLERYAEEIGVPVTDIVDMGLIQESSIFSLTMLSLRMASVINAVSKLHAKKAEGIWTDHPMTSITNGIHLPTWDTIDSGTKRQGLFLEKHCAVKKELLAFVKKTSGVTFHKNDLLFGWARRLVSYKRPLELFSTPRVLRHYAEKNRVRLIVAGEAHPSDPAGNAIANTLDALSKKELAGILVYLPNYTMDVARTLIPGCDVWLNTPIVGFEACGTSGMKAALNGVLLCSTRDGWVDQVDLAQWGWVLDDSRLSEHFMELLEQSIVPMFRERTNGIPKAWEDRQRMGRDTIMNRFSTTRALREYIEYLYM
ncbi:MAG: alpha-glucan family phosphorylase [Candidatus Uhrbacteria bacterium]|nr:alpha-glucan family phosphorylase [Candidatus Uhrbacteria bacterium]